MFYFVGFLSHLYCFCFPIPRSPGPVLAFTALIHVEPFPLSLIVPACTKFGVGAVPSLCPAVHSSRQHTVQGLVFISF